MVQVKIQKSLDYLLESIYNSIAHCSFAPSVKLMAIARTWGTEHVFPESISLSESVLLTPCLKLHAVKNYIFPNCMQPSLVDVNIHLGFLLFGLSGVTTPGQWPIVFPLHGQNALNSVSTTQKTRAISKNVTRLGGGVWLLLTWLIYATPDKRQNLLN